MSLSESFRIVQLERELSEARLEIVSLCALIAALEEAYDEQDYGEMERILKGEDNEV